MSLLVVTVLFASVQIVATAVRLRGKHTSSTASALRRCRRWSLGALAVFAVSGWVAFGNASLARGESRLAAFLDPTDTKPGHDRGIVMDWVQYASDRDKRVYMAVAACWFGYLLMRRHWSDARLFGLCVGVGFAVMRLVKTALDHVRRPDADSLKLATIWEWPSGHAFIVTMLAGLMYVQAAPVLSRRGRVVLVGVLTVLVPVIGIARVLVGTHYVSDVVGGICLGASWLAICVTIDGRGIGPADASSGSHYRRPENDGRRQAEL